jgi:protein O-GlcNAc transferase
VKRNPAVQTQPKKTPEGDNPLLKAISLQQQGRLAEAEALFRRILGVAPTNPAALYSLAVILLNSGRPQEGLALATVGIQANPDFAPLWFIHGVALLAAQQRNEALASLDRALVINPQYVDALVNSGALLHEMHRHREALERFHRVLAIDPNHETSLGNYGILLTEFKLGEQAVATFEHLIKQSPHYPYGLGLLCYERMHHCDWKDLHEMTRRITEGIRQGERTCKTLAYMALSDSASDHYLCANIFAKGQFPARPAPLWQGEAYRHARKRIAYVSPDLREHPVGHLMAGVIEAHDKSRFETIAISLGHDDGSRLRTRMMAAFDHFIDARDMHSRQIAELMREMEVDIAIDLAGYTSDSRTEVFLSRPAPIQVNYLGYPGTLGLDCYDYILADRTVIPEDHQAWYTEKPAYLEHCYLPIASGVEVAKPQPRGAYGLPEEGFVFCAFSHDYKIHPHLFAVWMRLLESNPGSILWLVSRNELSHENLRASAQRHGIARDRLIFATRVPKVEDHLARYRVADLFLDTWPYNAHTTAADALLAGLPVITYQGDSFPSRVASSLLITLGFEQLVSHSFEDYFDLANGLAHDPKRLKGLKKRLSPKALDGHPFLGQSFTRSLEKVLESLPILHPVRARQDAGAEPAGSQGTALAAQPHPGSEDTRPLDPTLDLAQELFQQGNLPQAEIYARQCFAHAGGSDAAARLIEDLRHAYGLPPGFVLSERTPMPGSPADRFLVIKAWGYDFWGEAHHLASQLLMAELTQRTPVVHWGSNSLFRGNIKGDASRRYFKGLSTLRIEELPRTATIFPAKWSWDNLDEENVHKWEGCNSRMAAQYFFARPESVLVSDFYSTISSIRPWIGRSSKYYGKTNHELYAAMFQKYLNPAPGIDTKVEAYYDRHMRGRPWVAVSAPEEDSTGESGAPSEGNADWLGFVDRIVELNPTIGVLLLTDSSRVIQDFEGRHGDRLLCPITLRPRTQRIGHGVAAAERAFMDVLLALKCDYLVSARESNESMAIACMRHWPEGFIFLLEEGSLQGENLALHQRMG